MVITPDFDSGSSSSNLDASAPQLEMPIHSSDLPRLLAECQRRLIDAGAISIHFVAYQSDNIDRDTIEQSIVRVVGNYLERKMVRLG